AESHLASDNADLNIHGFARGEVKKYGDRYVQYCKKTPFLLPLPPPLKKINFTTRRVGAAATATLFALIAVSYILQLTSFC
ncbi:MAG: hypothetical protein QXU59_07510, partial [Pyrobaculum sp.]